MRFPRLFTFILFVAAALLLMHACAPASAPVNHEVIKTVEVGKEGQAAPEAPAQPVEQAPLFTQAPQAEAPSIESTSAPSAPALLATQTNPPTASARSESENPNPLVPTPASPLLREDHIVQIEWPRQLRLGESDSLRLILVPRQQALELIAEYPEHQTFTQTIPIQRAHGYELFAVARLDGPGFEISPAQEQPQYLIPDQALQWRWVFKAHQPGDQRLSITLRLRWIPIDSPQLPTREVVAFSRSLDVQILSYLGLSQPQALLTGLFMLLFGSSISAIALIIRPHPTQPAPATIVQNPNTQLSIELPSGLQLNPDERTLLQSLFQRYDRLVVEQEFLSGYSGARTFLALPIRKDGRSDAYTIAKVGQRQAILKEFQNYETFVKDTLPPITARIQRPPISAPTIKSRDLSVLQYTFIGEPGQPPASLRTLLLTGKDPQILFRLLDTFGPNWWLQRKPYAFRAAIEYDRALPTHLVIQPVDGKGLELDGRSDPGQLHLKIGDLVLLRHFSQVELRPDGASLSLQGLLSAGRPPLRVRWLSRKRPENAAGRVVATRQTLLRGFVEGRSLYGLPDPLLQVDSILAQTVTGSQSILHGDLNLENILVGPGGMLWLIDFAQTREGHTLFDFSHLGAEIIAHVAAEQIDDPGEYLQVLRDPTHSNHQYLCELLQTLFQIANQLSFNPSKPAEFQISFALACLGALKYLNLTPHAKHLLLLTAAELLQRRQPEMGSPHSD